MYFWSTKKLAHALATDTMSNRSKLIHFIACICLFLVMPVMRTLSLNKHQEIGGHWAGALAIVDLVILLLGILYCYALNKRGDGKAFIERFILLSFPSIIRSVVLSFSLGMAIGLVEGMLRLQSNPGMLKAQLTGISIGCLLMYFLWVSSGLDMIAKVRTTEQGHGDGN